MTTISALRSRSLRQRSACSTSVEKTSPSKPGVRRRRLPALAQVGDPQFDALVAERGQRVQQPVGVGRRHVADEHADGALAATHALGDEVGEHLGGCQAGRHLRGSPRVGW